MTTRCINASRHEAKALHEGRATAIVRRMEPQPPHVGPNSGLAIREVVPSLLPNCGDLFDVRYRDDNPMAFRCPFGRISDVLEFREDWADVFRSSTRLHDRGYGIWPGTEDRFSKPSKSSFHNDIIYRADGEFVASNGDKHPWRSAAVMPKHAVRTHRVIASIDVIRVAEMTEEQAIRTGIECNADGLWKHYRKPKFGPSPVHSFQTLYESQHGEGSFAADWAWLIGLKGGDDGR